MKNFFTRLYVSHPLHKSVSDAFVSSSFLNIKGLHTSATSFFISSDNFYTSKPLVVCLDNEEDAAYMFNDFQNAETDREVFFYPFSRKFSQLKNAKTAVSSEFLLSKTEVLDRIIKLDNYVIVTYPEALAEKVISSENLIKNTLQLSRGNAIGSDFIIEVLDQYGFQHVDFVFEPGHYSQRGSIVDIFSFSNDKPYRIDFFGDEIDSIRSFDVMNQLSIEKVDSITIIPNICKDNDQEIKIPFFDFVNKDTNLWFNDLQYCIETIGKLESLKKSSVKSDDDLLNEDDDIKTTSQIIGTEEFLNSIKGKNITDLSPTPLFKSDKILEFNILPQPSFKKNFNLLADNIKHYQTENYDTHISVLNEKQNIRLHDIFASAAVNTKITFKHVVMNVVSGFIDNDIKLCLYTDHQIFERYLKYKLKETDLRKGREAIGLNELNTLKPGDYIVHSDHGIGVFGGLEQIKINGLPQEVIRLVYKDNDILFVSIHALHKISKYKGSEGESPKIYKLGSNTWSKLKQKTKSRVKDIAQDLIKLYAQRQKQKGFAFSADTYLQQALEASFIYEDTPDQEKTTAAVKADMESPVPMDRLVCGDVGFGKTEIAVRAAFKAVCDNKQVAILVPTTILAMQHYKTLTDRLKDFPCNVEYLSRLRSAKDTKEIIRKLKDGQIDIITGTHRIVGKDVIFKDLGLLIIDEEQKFGVAIKEKLKQLKINVDSLTLTATPIPRTLQFSLLGARDLSIINTPPPNRFPIVTEVHTFNKDIIKETIDYELDRIGQVFIIQNKIRDLYKTEELVKSLCPKATIVCAHGQMEGKQLEDIMLSFINQEVDILISTTIIESGLDIPNANTIIIMDAQNFGLSELHQLRGRVGRSNRKAFCYLFAPPEEILTKQARQRLKAIESFSELGSGINIAMQDLDIRGGGNLLGGEQSGFISEIGMETYQKILDEALTEIREQEYQQALTQSKSNNDDNTEILINQEVTFITDCTIDTDMELLFPQSYIENVSERVKMYRKLDNIKNETDLSEFETMITDRFGKLPDQSLQLFNIVRIRWKAIELGIERIILKNSKMICYLIADTESAYYQTKTFMKILLFAQHHAKICKIKETGGKPSLTIDNIKNPEKAYTALNNIIEEK